MSIINEREKRPGPRRSEKQVAQGDESRAKTVIANGENDETTTVDNEVQFGVPLEEVGSLTNLQTTSNWNQPYNEGAASENVSLIHQARAIFN